MYIYNIIQQYTTYIHQNFIYTSPHVPTCPFLQGEARGPGALQVALELVPGLGLEEPHAAHGRGHLELYADEALVRGGQPKMLVASPAKMRRNGGKT